MTAQDSITNAKLLHIVHLICSDIRSIAISGDRRQIYDMADAVEFVPQILVHWRPEAIATIRSVLDSLSSRHKSLGDRYLRILDMDDAEFAEVYLGEGLAIETE